MTLTPHGHHIHGTPTDDEPAPNVVKVIRCGGPRICERCAFAANAVLGNPDKPVEFDSDLRGELEDLIKDLDKTTGRLYLTRNEVRNRLITILHKP